MTKRGRKPQGEYAGKVSTISTRVTADLRQELQHARDESGRSLSQEIEDRLRRSFDVEKNIMYAFGDRRTYAFFRALAAVTESLWNPEDLDSFWLDDPYQFEQARRAISSVLHALRPEGETELETDSEMLRAAAELQGWERAANVLESVRQANPGSWSTVGRVKTDLGAVADRIPPVKQMTAGEARAFAEQLEKEEREHQSKSKRRKK